MLLTVEAGIVDCAANGLGKKIEESRGLKNGQVFKSNSEIGEIFGCAIDVEEDTDDDR
jgi:hypothetical protein